MITRFFKNKRIFKSTHEYDEYSWRYCRSPSVDLKTVVITRNILGKFAKIQLFKKIRKDLLVKFTMSKD